MSLDVDEDRRVLTRISYGRKLLQFRRLRSCRFLEYITLELSARPPLDRIPRTASPSKYLR